MISPSLFHDSVGPTVVSLPSTSPAHGSIAAASAAADIDFYTALPLLPSPPSSSASIFQPLQAAIAPSLLPLQPPLPRAPLPPLLLLSSLPNPPAATNRSTYCRELQHSPDRCPFFLPCHYTPCNFLQQ
ncbi:hypothetical protein GW17_00020584 [Ensete ventricosum]|nr:hypothetical protein GW17_00020584 [Ensete ventricosum]RZS00231.1 hypothetical protein BHM03_00029884 [Ensete ventricosum]